MIKKFKYSLKIRGFLGTFVLLGSYVRWYLYKIFSRKRTFLKRVNGYLMNLDLDDPGLSMTIGRGGARERAHTDVLLHELKEGMTILDVGANLGYYALMEALQIGPSGKVYAVEPVPNNFRFLSNNVRINGLEDRVEVFYLALSKENGKQTLFLSELSNLNSLYAQGEQTKQAMTGETIEVPTQDLQTFVEGKRDIDLIRMDIEGAEVDVLNSLALLCESCTMRPKVLFETHRSKYNDKDLSIEVSLRKLFAQGYTVKRLVSNSDDGMKWARLGYSPYKLVLTDGDQRGIYKDVSNEDALNLIVREGGVRAVLLMCG